MQIVARQRLYLLQLLKRQGLDSTCLDVLFEAIVLSTMLYAMPAFSGYLTESDVNSLQAVINKAFNLGYFSSIPDCVLLLAGLTASFPTNQTIIPSIVLFPLCLLSATCKLVQHFVPGVIDSVCHSVKVNFLTMRILTVYYSRIFYFNLFHFMFYCFVVLCARLRMSTFYVNKGLLLLLLLQHLHL